MNQPKDPGVRKVVKARKSGKAETPKTPKTAKDDAPAEIADGAKQDQPEDLAADPAEEVDTVDSGLDATTGNAADLAEIEDHAEEPGQRSLAATALTILVGVIVVAAATLWAAPRVAPHLPAGVAQYLLPGQRDTEAELTALRDALNQEAASARAEAAALNTAMAAGLDAARAETAAIAGRLDNLPATATADQALAAARDTQQQAAEIAARYDALAAEIAGLGEEMAAINAALASGGGGDGDSAASPEIAAAIAALGARLDTVAAAVAKGAGAKALEQRVAALTARVDAVEFSAADARSVQTEALGEVSTAIQQASLRAAAAALASRLASGLPYAVPMDEIAALTGAAVPAALATGAAAGLATAATLDTSFGKHAQAALAADVRANAGDDTGSQVMGWLRAQVTGRPIAEQQGDGVGATASRIAARVREGALPAALAEAESLPEPAQAGLGRWLDRLRARVAAERALTGWLAQIGAGG